MTPAERRQADLDRAFQQGWDDGADDEPLTDEEIEAIALLLQTVSALRLRHHKAVPLPAAA